MIGFINRLLRPKQITEQDITLVWEFEDYFIIQFRGKEGVSYERVSPDIGLKKINDLQFSESKTLWKNTVDLYSEFNKELKKSITCYFDDSE